MAASTTARRFVDLDTVALLELVRAGDHDAYGELFARYHDFAYKVARRQSRRHADDYVAEAFRRILTAISRGAGPTQGFGPYLAATIRSVAAGQAAPYQEVELDVSILLDDESADVDPRVSTAYLSLPEAWQNALWYSDVEGMSPRHAAPLLDLPSANAFSALRKRARAGLRSAYLTQVVDDACNDDVRRHLHLLMAGDATAEAVDALVDEHLADCDECAAIAWRVAAVSGNTLGVALAPAMLAFHGFAVSSTLLPAGLGATGLIGWFRRTSKTVVAALTVGVVVGLVMAAVVVGASLRSDGSTADAIPAAGETADGAVAGDAVADDADADPGNGGGAGQGDPPAAAESDTGGDPDADAVADVSTTTVPVTTVPVTTVPAAGAAPTTVPGPAVDSSPVAPSTTTAPAVPAVPAVVATTTTVPVTTTTVPVTTTTVPVTTTTVPVTTTTVPVTTVPVTTVPVRPGTMYLVADDPLGNPAVKRVYLVVLGLTGEPGTISVSAPFSTLSSDNLSCGPSACTLVGAVAPTIASVEMDVAVGPVTFELRDSSGAVIQTITSP